MAEKKREGDRWLLLGPRGITIAQVKDENTNKEMAAIECKRMGKKE